MARKLVNPVLALVVAMSLWLVALTTPATAAAANLTVCGKVVAYVPATSLTAGALTLGAVPLVVAAGVDLPSTVRVGANLCLQVRLDSASRISDVLSVKANAAASINICGRISAYAAARARAAGSLTIAGRTLAIAAGTPLPASVRVGANLCLSLNVNGAGQVTKGTVRANTTTTARVCGVVTGYLRSTTTSAGRLSIGGRSFPIGLGASLPAAVKAGANLCTDLQLNTFGQIKEGTARANVTTAVDVCGRVNAVAAASPTADGRLSIGSRSWLVAAGADLPASVRTAAYVKARLAVDAFGRLARVSVVRAGANLADACEATGSQPSPTPSPSDGASLSGNSSVGPSGGALRAEGGVAFISPDGGQARAAPSTSDGGQAAFGANNNTRDSNGAPRSATGRSDLAMPSTDTFLHTGSTVAGMAVPALAGGLIAAVGFALGRRRSAANWPEPRTGLGLNDGEAGR
jgi:hypothetical protein